MIAALAAAVVLALIPFDGDAHSLTGAGPQNALACVSATVGGCRPETVPAGGTAQQDTLVEVPAGQKEAPTGVSPKGAAVRSVLYPGLGQLANGKFYKACAVFGVETYFLSVAILSGRRAQDILDRSASVASDTELAELERKHESYLDRRNSYFWWLGVAILYSMLDAYVDASLAGVEKGMSGPPPVFIDSTAGEDGSIRLGIGARF